MTVMIDGNNIERLAEFWSAVLGFSASRPTTDPIGSEFLERVS